MRKVAHQQPSLRLSVVLMACRGLVVTAQQALVVATTQRLLQTNKSSNTIKNCSENRGSFLLFKVVLFGNQFYDMIYSRRLGVEVECYAIPTLRKLNLALVFKDKGL